MPVKNFSSVGGYSVAATEVMNTDRALKNISAMHMVSNHFTDANKDIFILKRQTDAANNTMDLSLDGTTPLATNTPPLVNDSVAFASGTIFGQETSNNTYVYAAKFDIVITTSSTGTPTVASERKIIVRNNPPGQETWNVVPSAITIGGAPFFTFQVSSVTTTSTVKWIGNLELTVVS
ncbi:virion structural protein [Eurybiavirus PHM1]|uniref:Virion structural protein n=1 Tax=Prochlorococcus phage P-HM1 TaxID=445700 RepID=E3SMS7_9CAUD|nr:virion structural protein [Prochlorococcus phage P-HM1]ADO98720.1 virion structural protein [Prochlorococcus phage P-HM1]|tara:strand:+ start:63 stop:596 length:534 start_codon:yes stop_codon:yes gene_type:complete